MTKTSNTPKPKIIAFDLGGVVVSSFGDKLREHAESILGTGWDKIRPLMNKYEPALQRGEILELTFWNAILEDAVQEGYISRERAQEITDEDLMSI